MTPKPTEKIPNDPLSYENIETEDLYFEDDYFKPTEAKITLRHFLLTIEKTLK